MRKHLKLATTLAVVLSLVATFTPNAVAQSESSELAADLAADVHGQDARIRLESVEPFDPEGSDVVLQPGTESEESFSYSWIDVATNELVGLTRPRPLSHPAGSVIEKAVEESSSPSTQPSSSPAPSASPVPTSGSSTTPQPSSTEAPSSSQVEEDHGTAPPAEESSGSSGAEHETFEVGASASQVMDLQVPTTVLFDQGYYDQVVGYTGIHGFTVYDQNSRPMQNSNQTWSAAVVGSNPQTFSGVLDSGGRGWFTYTGVRPGIDTLNVVAGSAACCSAARSYGTGDAGGNVGQTPASVVFDDIYYDQAVGYEGIHGFTVRNAAGTPISTSLAFTAVIRGANNQTIISGLDGSGRGWFSYRGSNAGTDTLTVTVGNVSGVAARSYGGAIPSINALSCIFSPAYCTPVVPQPDILLGPQDQVDDAVDDAILDLMQPGSNLDILAGSECGTAKLCVIPLIPTIDCGGDWSSPASGSCKYTQYKIVGGCTTSSCNSVTVTMWWRGGTASTGPCDNPSPSGIDEWAERKMRLLRASDKNERWGYGPGPRKANTCAHDFEGKSTTETISSDHLAVFRWHHFDNGRVDGTTCPGGPCGFKTSARVMLSVR